MTLRILRRVTLLVGLLVVIAGCGPAPAPPAPDIGNADCKKTLQDIASAGQLNSSLNIIPPFLEKLQEKDAGLAASLKEDYEKLTKSQDPAEIKEIAERMAAKL